MTEKKDEVNFVKPDGTFIASEDKYEAHKYPSKLHLAISVWLFNSKGQVLFQQRSKKKIVGADWWANTVCGNVWPRETYLDCANRRLDFELGITDVDIKPVYKFSYKAYGNEMYGEHEIDQVYVGLFEGFEGQEEGNDGTNPDEVSNILWLNFEELVAKVSTIDYVFAEESLLLNHKNLKEKTQPVKINIGGQELLIAPWTVLMLKDSRFLDACKKII